MNKVLIINLAGRAFNLEEAGYDALRGYLDEAEHSLADNPDKAEILADIESAIAEKCATYLRADKSVITSEETQTIIKEMGPVSGSAEGAEPRPHDAPKRLYRIREGAVISGVCNGLAAFFNLDVTLMRIIFILLAVFTSGGFCFAYFLMMIFIPEAHTPSQRAESMGGIPTAQEVINNVKKAYETGTSEWRKWEARSREERRRWKQEYRRQWRYYRQPHRSPFWEFMNSLLGMVWFLIIVGLGILAYEHIAWVHVLLNQVPAWLKEGAQQVVAWVRSL